MLATAAIFLLASCQAATAIPGGGGDMYIATDGSDRNPGTRAKPFATLDRARDAVREMKRSGRMGKTGVTVWIRGGVYQLKSGFKLGAEDSGSANAPVVYRAYPDEEVRLVGGKEISGFRPVTDPAVLDRLDPPCRAKIVQVDLKAQEIRDFGTIKPRGFGKPTQTAGLELFFGGRPMTLARWPNDGWARIVSAPAGNDGGKFTYDGDRPSRWRKADDIWLHGYWTHDWAESYTKVQSIDTKSKLIATQDPHGVYGYTADRRYYALNILEELDHPGEWYLDRDTGILYFWPPASLRKSTTVVSLLEEPMVSLEDASYVTLRGLTFECARGDAVRISGGTGNLIADCAIRNIGSLGIKIAGGTSNGVSGCEIYETGEGGIVLEGGDRKTLTPAGNYVVNCHIHDFSRWCRTYRPAIAIRGVGNRAAHNLIHDAPHSAIILGGNEHIIEFNEIHDVCRETGDAGAFYMGRNLTARGNVVRFNYFHDISSRPEELRGYKEVMAVYLDDCSSGTRVYGNVFRKAGRAAFIGGGRDNVIQNNIFIDCNPSIHVDARGAGWASFWFDGRDNTLMDGLNVMNYKEPPYSLRYPELLTLLDDEPALPKGNALISNVMSGGAWLDLNGLNEDILDIRGNLIEGDPLFVDAAAGNFKLKPQSPAFKLGFKQIPLEKIGLLKGRYSRALN